MNFKEWLISEVGFADVPIELQHYKMGIFDRYVAEFQDNGVNFEVSFNGNSLKYQGTNVPSAYVITFSGPQGLSTTGQSGTRASAIYSKVMAAVKKMNETVPVNAFMFNAAELSMALVYKKLFDRMGSEFTQVTPNTYMKKTYLRELLGGMTPEKKSSVYKDVLGTGREVRDNIADIRRRKIAGRANNKPLGPTGWEHL